MYSQRQLVIFAIFMATANGLLRYTNIKCKVLDPTFVSFPRCDLKVLGRDVIGLTVHAKVLKLPVTNASVNLSMFKKANGYRPFLYNVSADLCDFFRHSKRNPFLKIYVDSLRNFSNINHTCPYNHDIIVNNMTLKEEMLKLLPLPAGEYMFILTVGAYNDWKAVVRSYLASSDQAPTVMRRG